MDEEPTVKRALRDEELRWREMVDKACEGNQELIDVKNAISDIRHRRKKEFREQQRAEEAGMAIPSRAYIEEITDPTVECPSSIGPVRPGPLPSAPPAASLSLSIRPVPQGFPVVEPLRAVPAVESPQEVAIIVRPASVPVRPDPSPPTPTPPPAVPAVPCIVSRVFFCVVCPMLHIRSPTRSATPPCLAQSAAVAHYAERSQQLRGSFAVIPPHRHRNLIAPLNK